MSVKIGAEDADVDDRVEGGQCFGGGGARRRGDLDHRAGHQIRDLLRLGVREDRALVHQQHASTAFGLVEIGRCDQQGQPLAYQIREQPPELAPRNRVDPGRRFVKQQGAGRMDESAGQGELLFHASGEPIGEAVVERCEPDELEQLTASLLPFGDAVHESEELDVLVNREVAVEGESLRQITEPGVESPARPPAIVAKGPRRARSRPFAVHRGRAGSMSCRRRRGRSDPPPRPA